MSATFASVPAATEPEVERAVRGGESHERDHDAEPEEREVRAGEHEPLGARDVDREPDEDERDRSDRTKQDQHACDREREQPDGMHRVLVHILEAARREVHCVRHRPRAWPP